MLSNRSQEARKKSTLRKKEIERAIQRKRRGALYDEHDSPRTAPTASSGSSQYSFANLPQQSAVALPRSKQKRLPIFLNGVLVKKVRADSGSELNCISEKPAKKIGASLKPMHQDHRLPVKGMNISSFATAFICCNFPSEASLGEFEFFVFKKLKCDILIGRAFLRGTGTLDKHQHRLKDLETRAQSIPVINSTGQTGENLNCWFDGVPRNAIPDTGADRNLLSLQFAKTLGYRSGRGPKQIQRIKHEMIQ
jgi:hypothetical protein